MPDEVKESVAQPGNPIAKALAELQVAEPDVDEMDTSSEPVDDVAGQEPEETNVQEDTEASGHESTDVESDEPAQEGDEPESQELFSVELPMPNADGSKGPRGTGVIELEGLPQEAADAIRYHIKQSERLGVVEQELAQVQDAAWIADFVESDPMSAMVLIERAEPDVARSFVAKWFEMHPTEVPQLLKDLELEDLTDREAKLMAKNAKSEAEKAALAALQEHGQKATLQRRADEYMRIAQTLGREAGIPADEMDEFLLVVSRRVANAYSKNPDITHRDVVATVKPILERYMPRRQSTNETPQEAQERMKTRIRKAKKFRKAAGTGAGSMRESTSFKRMPKGTGLSEAIRKVTQSP